MARFGVEVRRMRVKIRVEAAEADLVCPLDVQIGAALLVVDDFHARDDEDGAVDDFLHPTGGGGVEY